MRAQLEFTQLLNRVHERLSRIDSSKATAASEPFDLINDFEKLGATLQQLRASQTSADLLQTYEDSYSLLWSQLSTRQPKTVLGGSELSWVQRYRLIWRAYLPLFFFTLSLFVISSIVGFSIGIGEPDYVTLLVPQELLEQVLDQKAWFEKIQEGPLLAGLAIAWNNIRVAVNCFLLGAIAGIGGLILLCFNGLHLGALFGFCLNNNFADALGRFVLAHGPLELSIIVCSAFASMVYGRAFFTRPFKDFTKNMREGASHAATIILGTAPWLIVAAIFEAFMSPFPDIPISLRLTAGLSLAAIFWIWTFWPVERQSP